jgi:NADH-quinone oxidoreductase subunit A
MTVPYLCGSIRFCRVMPRAYIPVLIFAFLAAAFPAVTLVIFAFIRPSSGAVGAKLKPYECGIVPESDARGRYSVRFYIVAILFVIFDVETVFLFPWAVDYSMLGVYGLISMFLFLGILIVGYVWLYRKGALEWL